MFPSSKRPFLLTYFLACFCSTLFAQNVGIGEANPAQKLHISNNARVDGAYIANPTNVTPDGAGGVTAAVNLSMLIVDDDATAINNTLALTGTPTAGQLL